MLTGPAWLPCAQRPVEAYRETVTAAGLPVRIVPGGFSSDCGRAAALEVMARWPDTDAIHAICDTAAFGAIGALRSLGVRVPGDVAVAGFDDVPAAAWSGPALTTATHPVDRIASDAAAALLRGQAPPEVRYPSEIVLRESA
jgi:DNA-binding LacI/PurR family transcriptional regulator